MSDEREDFDPCACMFNHDFVMQRLLSILRQSQAYCTDNECLTLSSLPGPEPAPSNNHFMMICLIAIVGMLLYVFRPQSLRQTENGAKARDNDPHFDDEPPMPPPAIN